MPEVTRWLCLFSALSVVGCQSSGSLFSWWPSEKNAREDAMEFAALENQPPAVVASAELPQTAASKDKNSDVVASGRIDTLISDGVRAISAQQLDQAKMAFEEVLRVEPNHATAHQGLAMVADLTKNWGESDFHYKQALRIRPRDPGLLNDVGYSYLLQGRYQEAGSYLNQAIELNPRHEKAQENLAMLSLRKGDRADAESRLMKLYPVGEAKRHLARLEEDLRSNDEQLASQIPDTRPIPTGATLEEVRQLAALERIAAEEERKRRSMPRPMLPEEGPAVSDMLSSAGPIQYPTYQNPSMQSAIPASNAVAHQSMPDQQNNNRLMPNSQFGMTPSPGVAAGYRVSEPAAVARASAVSENALSNSVFPGQPQLQPSSGVGPVSGYENPAVVPAGGLVSVRGGAGYQPPQQNGPNVGGPAPYSPAHSTAGAPVHLAGLNAGPGTLFPLENSAGTQPSYQSSGLQPPTAPPHSTQSPNAPQQGYQQPNPPLPNYQQPAIQQPNYQQPNYQQVQGQQLQRQQAAAVPNQNPYTGQPMATSSVGGGLMLNSAAGATPSGVMPSQQWAQQQQQAGLNPQLPTTLSGYNPNQPSQNEPPQNLPSQNQGAWPAGWQADPNGSSGQPAANAAVMNAAPLNAYEQSLQKSENQPINSLQQMNRQAAPVSPVQARY